MATIQATRADPAARVFWTYWTAGAVSSMGSAVTAVALPLTAVSVLRASPLQVSLVAAAGYVAWIVIGLPAGVITQRLPLRGVQVAMDLARFVAIMSIPVAWWLGLLTAWHLALSALVVSFASVLFDVSSLTFLPSIVPREQLASRNSLTSATHATTELGGPSLGGLLVQLLGAVPTLVVDAVSYLVSAALLRSLPARSVDRPDHVPRMGPMIREGWQFVVRHPVMRPCMLLATTINFVCGALLALVPLHLVRDLRASPAVVGALLATEGVGSLVGAAATPRLVRKFGSARALVAANLFLAATVLVLPLGSGWVGAVCFAIGNIGFAAGVVVSSICARTHRQLASPPLLLSRVLATVRFVSWGAIPVGSLLAGLTATVVGVRAALVSFCLLAWLTPAVVSVSPIRGLRNLEDLDT